MGERREPGPSCRGRPVRKSAFKPGTMDLQRRQTRFRNICPVWQSQSLIFLSREAVAMCEAGLVDLSLACQMVGELFRHNRKADTHGEASKFPNCGICDRAGEHGDLDDVVMTTEFHLHLSRQGRRAVCTVSVNRS